MTNKAQKDTFRQLEVQEKVMTLKGGAKNLKGNKNELKTFGDINRGLTPVLSTHHMRHAKNSCQKLQRAS